MKNTLVQVLPLLAGLSMGAPMTFPKQAVRPLVSGAPQILGLVSDPAVNRDSCASALFDKRVLWTCRDTQPMQSDGAPEMKIWSSSASWTNPITSSMPELSETHILKAYGSTNEQPFYPILDDECNNNTAGACSDGTRYAIWPDSPPLVTSHDNSTGAVTAYTWIKKSHIHDDLSTVVPHPATSLYRVSYNPSNASSPDALPSVSLVNENFWLFNGIPYGDYGGVVSSDGWAYLYASTPNGVALAKVLVANIEDATKYQYFVDGAWTSTMPDLDDARAAVPNVSAGGQGTYYYSEKWQSYVWIGQGGESVSAQFYITTAPKPEGPWIKPYAFYTAPSGNYSLGAYSLAANPALVPADRAGQEIYLTYTKTDTVRPGVNTFSTPLVRVQWQ